MDKANLGKKKERLVILLSSTGAAKMKRTNEVLLRLLTVSVDLLNALSRQICD